MKVEIRGNWEEEEAGEGGGITGAGLSRLLPVDKRHLESLNRVAGPDLVIMITTTGLLAMPVTGLIVRGIREKRATATHSGAPTCCLGNLLQSQKKHFPGLGGGGGDQT